MPTTENTERTTLVMDLMGRRDIGFAHETEMTEWFTLDDGRIAMPRYAHKLVLEQQQTGDIYYFECGTADASILSAVECLIMYALDMWGDFGTKPNWAKRESGGGFGTFYKMMTFWQFCYRVDDDLPEDVVNEWHSVQEEE